MSAIASALRDLFQSSSPNIWTNSEAWSPMGGYLGMGPSAYGNYSTTSGEQVNEKTAMLVSAHFACVRCKSEDLSILPREVYEVNVDGEKQTRRDSEIWRILNEEMNPEMSAAKGMETLIAHAIGFKKGVAEIERDGSGNAIALWPLDPILVTKKRIAGRIIHEYRRGAGDVIQLPDEDVFEIIGPTYDGLTAYSMAEITKYTIGLALAAQKFQTAFFGNGSWLGGLIQKLPKGMTPEARTALIDSIEQRHRSAAKAFSIGALPGEAEWKEIGIDPQKGETMNSLNFTVIDLCRAHRTPPHKVQEYKDAHYNNVEQAEIVYRSDALMPLGTVIEQEAQRKLLPQGWIVRHNYNAFQRVDFKTQQDGLAVGRQWGWWSINDCRKKLGENPIDEDWANEHLIPANMMAASKIYEVKTNPTQAKLPAADPSNTQNALKESFVPLVLDGVKRAADKEEKAVARMRGKGGQEGKINAFYEEHKAYVAQSIIPVLGALSRALGNPMINTERLQVIGELYLVEYISARPAADGPIDEAWAQSFAERCVDAVMAAMEAKGIAA